MCSKPLPTVRCRTIGSCGINNRFQLVSRTQGQVAHALLTRPPLIRGPKPPSPFDLNVLCTPPALILSQDQTLEIILSYPSAKRAKINFELDCSFFTIFRVVFLFQNCRDISHLLCFILSLVVQFSKTVCRPLFAATCTL